MWGDLLVSEPCVTVLQKKKRKEKNALGIKLYPSYPHVLYQYTLPTFSQGKLLDFKKAWEAFFEML